MLKTFNKEVASKEAKVSQELPDRRTEHQIDHMDIENFQLTVAGGYVEERKCIITKSFDRFPRS